ncbi:UDP-N-acetylmuramate--L-alanine ligase [Bacteroidia bacterium]|nr:UDP-N-acetylmuramate--L-alanine ligase [Bacteroidia bacterium]
MIAIANIRTAYFLGIGGIGMSALARFLHSQGAEIYGYDRTRTLLCQQLENEGMHIHYTADIAKIPPTVDVIVYTPAVPADFEEFVFLQNKSIPMLKRAELLGLITQSHFAVGIAGTHGKTTISTLTAHLLNQTPKKTSAFLGGISKNYGSNLLISDVTDAPMVVEADEFDRSFLKLHPDMAVVSSMDADHLDIYGHAEAIKRAFQDYADLVPESQPVFVKYKLPLRHKQCRYYHLDDHRADYYTQNLRVDHRAYHFDFCAPQGTFHDLVMHYPGLHNVENAVVSMAVALSLGATETEIRTGLASFTGVYRRFDIRINTPQLMYIDDYAHHPNEIRTTIQSLKHFLKDKPIVGVFQPHLYTRTRDFADDFAKSLSLLDNLILLDIYPAREQPIPGITSQMLLDKCTSPHKVLCHKSELIMKIKEQTPQVLLTMGAGDIDAYVEPITKAFSTYE